MRLRSLAFSSGLALGTLPFLATAAPDTPARVEVSLVQSAAANPPIGTNGFGDPGAFEFSAGNLIYESGFEPISSRRRVRVSDTGVENGIRWFTYKEDGGMTNWDLMTTGTYNGANVRIYRIVDAQGNPLPQTTGTEAYLDLANAARYTYVGSATIPVAGSPGLPLGGWVTNTYTQPSYIAGTRTSLDYTDAVWVENGKTYYYKVTAVVALPLKEGETEPATIETDLNLGPEYTATPQAGLPKTPHIYVSEGHPFNEIPAYKKDGWFWFAFKVAGATGPVTWELLDTNNTPLALPDFTLDPSGTVGGNTRVELPPTPIRLRATTSAGVITRDFVINNPVVPPGSTPEAPLPPANVTVTPSDGYVHLSWTPSPSPNVIGYRLYRSEVPRAQQRERAYLSADAPVLVKDDYLLLDKRLFEIDHMWGHPRVRKERASESWRPNTWAGTSVRRVPHTAPLPAEFRFPGESCYEVKTTGSAPSDLSGPWLFFRANGSGEDQWYSQLEPGRTYRYEAWLRQEGLGDGGRIHLGFGGQYDNLGRTFTVDGQWRLYSFEFTAPARPTEGNHGCPSFRFNGPGTFWVDNIRLFRADTPADITATLTPASPIVFDELMASQPTTGEKGILRNMAVLLNKAPIASSIALHRYSVLALGWEQGVSTASNLTLPHFLQNALRTGSSPATRMKPWLNVSSHSTEDEWLTLIEYLAAPIDPNNPADVAAKPWAHLRYLQRGTATPWTDEFPRIFIEFANETWHNGAVSDEWAGWGRPGFMFSGTREFGLFSHFITTHLTTRSPYYNSANAAGKLRLVMGSNYGDYGELAAAGAPLVHDLTHASYVGPKWETGDQPLATYDDHGMQATLLGYPADVALLFAQYRRYREELAIAGHPMGILGYEGGPSGYAIPGVEKDAGNRERAEQYGKSLAMAVAALDSWLGGNEAGFAEMTYFNMSIGTEWSSHTPIAEGYRPHVGWLAMTLRNRFASGRMLRTALVSTPTIPWDGHELPLVSAYTFRDGKRLGVFLLSRKLAGVHDNHDWGDGSTPVTLTLPANPTGPATLYRLTGDPRATNRAAMDVAIQQSSVTLGRETTVSLPQGSIYLYVVDTDLPDRDDPAAVPATPAIAYDATGATLSWPAIPGATGYTIYRSRKPYFDYADVTATFTSATPSFRDNEAVSGSTYYYRVAASNGWGTAFWTLVAAGGTNRAVPLVPAPELDGLGESEGSLTAIWGEVPGATGYRVGLATNPEGPFTWTDAGIATSWTFPGLQPGTTYHAAVYATCALGRGPASEVRSGTPLAAGAAQVIAAWDAAALNYSDHLSDPPSQVPLGRHTSSISGSPITRGPGLTIRTDLYGFPPQPSDGRAYDGQFPSYPTEDGGNFGAPEGGSLANAVARGLYIGCTVTPQPGQSISFASLDTGFQFGSYDLDLVLRYRVGSGSWHDVPAPVGYKIFFGPFGSRNDVTFPLATEAPLQNATEPVELRFYFYRDGTDARYCHVSLIRSTGDEVIVHGTARTLARPGQPAGLRSSTGPNQVSLAWAPVSGAASYTLRWGTAPGAYTGSLPGLTQATATVTGLPNGVPHYFVVEAVNSFGTSPRSAEIAATPIDNTSGFLAWQSAHFTPAQLAAGLGAMAADPDADGQSNLVEYAFGTVPLTAGTTAYQIGTAGTPARLTATLPLWSTNNDITITLEASTDLTTWTPLARSTAGGAVLPLVSGVQVIGTSGTPGVFVIQDDPSHASVPRRFFRVSVSTP